MNKNPWFSFDQKAQKHKIKQKKKKKTQNMKSVKMHENM